MDVHEEEEHLLRALRVQKQFSKIIIHDGLPKLAEIDGTTSSGRKYTKSLNSKPIARARELRISSFLLHYEPKLSRLV